MIYIFLLYIGQEIYISFARNMRVTAVCNVYLNNIHFFFVDRTIYNLHPVWSEREAALAIAINTLQRCRRRISDSNQNSGPSHIYDIICRMQSINANYLYPTSGSTSSHNDNVYTYVVRSGQSYTHPTKNYDCTVDLNNLPKSHFCCVCNFFFFFIITLLGLFSFICV